MNSAVLVIDVQTVLFDPQPQPFERDQVISRINQVTEWAHGAGVTVIFVQHEKPDSVIAYGSEGWSLQGELLVTPQDHRIGKQTPDSFLNTELDELLKKHQIKHLIVCGYASEFCIDTSIRSAAALGYDITLLADAHTTHDKEHANAEQIRQHENITLPHLTSFGRNITAVTTEQFLAKTTTHLEGAE